MIRALNYRYLPSLNELGLTLAEDSREKYTDYVIPIQHQMLTDLSLHNVIHSMRDLHVTSKSKCLTNLQKLDISHSSGIRGCLSILLCHSLLSLNNLILKDCGLSSRDLRSLAEANVKGRIPELKHLDVSQNVFFENELNKLFDLKCRWETLVKLNIEGTSLNCFNDLNVKVKSGCHSALKELRVCTDIGVSHPTNAEWPSLTDLQLLSNRTQKSEKTIHYCY